MSKRWKITLGIVTFSIFIGLFVISLKYTQPKRTLPVLNPSQLNPALVSPELQNIGRGHRVGDFHLVDQQGNTVTGSDTDGKIRVVEFFFTTCPGICKVMAEELKRVYSRFADEDQLLILSHTVMPETDDVPTLATYAEKKGIDYNRWRLLTGDKDEIYRLARQVYFVVPEQPDNFNQTDSSDNHDFIHTENIVLVDTEGRLRGYYDGTNSKEMDQLMDDIELLLRP
jgi:protein SCO1